MNQQREKLLLDLARLVAKHGADEVLDLVQAMRDPRVVTGIAALLEQVATTQPLPRARTGPARTHGPGRKRAGVRVALREGYPTFASLGPLLRRVGLVATRFDSVEAAHRAIVDRLDKVKHAEEIEDEILDNALRDQGELGQLADAIVSKGGKR